ncbi:MAG: hypothetical protein EP297_08615 [Gammaproteobacteria bacterium]|nr:MAG: hypothetical protein EP297_08615 [Gammaproteobacteria bacterium]
MAVIEGIRREQMEIRLLCLVSIGMQSHSDSVAASNRRTSIRRTWMCWCHGRIWTSEMAMLLAAYDDQGWSSVMEDTMSENDQSIPGHSRSCASLRPRHTGRPDHKKAGTRPGF